MDVYEFTEALRRQRRLLIVGSILLVTAVFMVMFKVSGNGIESRIPPSYQASMRMAVTSADVESLGDASEAGIADAAGFFAAVLQAPDAGDAIMEATGVKMDSLTVSTTGPVITATVVAATPDAAIVGAVAAYEWLADQIDEPRILAGVTPTTQPPSLLDAAGRLPTELAVQVSPAFAESGRDLWLQLSAEGGDIASFSLGDAALAEVRTGPVAIRPGTEITVGLEDLVRTPLDEATLAVPELPGPDTEPYTLRLRVDRGSVIGLPASSTEEGAGPVDHSGVRLFADRFALEWQRSEGAVAGEEQATSSVGILRLTDEPLASLTGARRGPIMTLAALFGGMFALVVLAIAVDSWKEARRSRAVAVYTDRLAVIRPIHGGKYDGVGPLSHRLNVAGGDDAPRELPRAEGSPE